MQKLRYSRYLKTIVILLDITVLALSLWLFSFDNNRSLEEIIFQEKTVISLILLVMFWLLLGSKTNIYNVPRNLTYTSYIQSFLTHIFIFISVFLLFSRILDIDFLKNSRFMTVVFMFVSFLFLKSLIFFFLKYIRSKGLNYRNVMFIGNASSSEMLKAIIKERKDYGYKIFEYSTEKLEINSLKKFWEENGIHTIFLPSENYLNKDLESALFEEAEKHKVNINLIPNTVQNEFFSYRLSYIESQPVLLPVKFPLEYYSNAMIKRIADMAMALIFLLLIGWWLFPLIALLIKTGSKGPVFFLQKRYGFHDEIFTCIKFRTMYLNTESSSKTTEENDKRITRVGKFLRKTSLDETPQFINVLLGNMSVVGPRPHMILVDDLYKPKIRRYSVRSMVKPGITGLAQVNGLRGDKGDMDMEMKRRVLADSYYVKNWSFSLDLIIIFKTIILLIEGDKNAH